MWSGLLIRQARLRRGLSQEEFAQRIGRDRAVVVRWERGVNRPTYDTLREVLGAVGFDLPPRLVDLGEEPGTEHDGFLRRLRETPQERLAEARDRAGRCEPWRIIAALDQHRTAYVFVGVLAAVIHGSGERAAEVEIVPRVRADNLARVALALADLASPDIVVDSERSSTSYPTSAGALRISIAQPGSGGYDDLRRQAAREPIGEGATARRKPARSAADRGGPAGRRGARQYPADARRRCRRREHRPLVFCTRRTTWELFVV